MFPCYLASLKLGLFANIRPVRYIVGPRKPFHFCVIRKNSEDLAGLDFCGVFF
ncbi:hypothetical protein O9A_01357 [Bartonella koehlerae C-29]|uniref:Uncharacterized protein n=1 Tax=Bartonella koehlerae C-29 TaxID=1134510 RepID=A0A067WD52_9HYPH|nr:hypothetical protein O9A_01357 [Bartonella koehlerae C-29]